MKNKIKIMLNICGDALLVLFILSLLGVAVYMVLKKEVMAEKFGTFAYIALVITAILKAVSFGSGVCRDQYRMGQQ